MSITCPTLGQRVANHDLQEAIRRGKPFVLLFGDAGSGKSSVIDGVLRAIDPNAVLAFRLSATGSDFAASPTFEALLEAICKQQGIPALPDQRPAFLAALAAAVGAAADAGKKTVLSIDHADRLGDDVIDEVARLDGYLDVSTGALVRIFVGSSSLASRIDLVLRRTRPDQRLTEIRLSQPTAEEVATILAYEDSARAGGPMLSPPAIGRICAYAKCNLHWAVPMADAARALAESKGAREITPELVHEALLDIWSPEYQGEGASPDVFERAEAGGAEARSGGSEDFGGLADSAGQPVVVFEPARTGPVPADGRSWREHLRTLYERTRAKVRARNRLALLSGAAAVSLLAGLGAIVFLISQGGQGVERSHPAADGSQPLQIESPVALSPTDSPLTSLPDQTTSAVEPLPAPPVQAVPADGGRESGAAAKRPSTLSPARKRPKEATPETWVQTR